VEGDEPSVTKKGHKCENQKRPTKWGKGECANVRVGGGKKGPSGARVDPSRKKKPLPNHRRRRHLAPAGSHRFLMRGKRGRCQGKRCCRKKIAWPDLFVVKVAESDDRLRLSWGGFVLKRTWPRRASARESALQGGNKKGVKGYSNQNVVFVC